MFKDHLFRWGSAFFILLLVILLLTVRVPALVKAQAPDLKMINQPTEPVELKLDETQVINFTLNNAGDAPAISVRLQVTLPTGVTVIPGGIQPQQLPPIIADRSITWVLPNIAPTQSIDFELPLQVRPDAPSTPSPIEISFSSAEQAEGEMPPLFSIPVTIIGQSPIATPPPPSPTEAPVPTLQPSPTPILTATPLQSTEEPPEEPTDATSAGVTEEEAGSESSPGWLTPLLYIAIAIVGVAALALVVVGIIYLYRSRKPKPPEATPPPSPSSPPSPSPTPIIPYLEYRTQSGEHRRLALDNLDDGGEVIGRAMPEEGVTLRIDQTFPGWETVSRHHARIYREPGGRVVIEDNRSQNGIQVEGRRTARNLLKNGWRVTIGGIEFVYREGQANTEPKLPAND